MQPGVPAPPARWLPAGARAPGSCAAPRQAKGTPRGPGEGGDGAGPRASRGPSEPPRAARDGENHLPPTSRPSRPASAGAGAGEVRRRDGARRAGKMETGQLKMDETAPAAGRCLPLCQRPPTATVPVLCRPRAGGSGTGSPPQPARPPPLPGGARAQPHPPPPPPAASAAGAGFVKETAAKRRRSLAFPALPRPARSPAAATARPTAAGPGAAGLSSRAADQPLARRQRPRRRAGAARRGFSRHRPQLPAQERSARGAHHAAARGSREDRHPPDMRPGRPRAHRPRTGGRLRRREASPSPARPPWWLAAGWGRGSPPLLGEPGGPRGGVQALRRHVDTPEVPVGASFARSQGPLGKAGRPPRQEQRGQESGAPAPGRRIKAPSCRAQWAAQSGAAAAARAGAENTSLLGSSGGEPGWKGAQREPQGKTG